MILKELITELEGLPREQVVRWGFDSPHSWRGVYAELAFEPATDITIGEMLDAARSAIGATYQGYKGGDFTMGEYTDIHISRQGNSDDLMGELLFNYIRGYE